MKKILIIGAEEYNWSEHAFLFPVRYNGRLLARRGYVVEYSRDGSAFRKGAGTICLIGRRFRGLWAGSAERILGFLKGCRPYCEKLVWIDLTDSSGTTQFDVLPHVDGYLKCLALRDRRLYLRSYYGSRIFTDFYHSRFGINDREMDAAHLNRIPAEDQLSKIQVAWNPGMADFGGCNRAYARFLHHLDFLPRFYSSRWIRPGNAGRKVFTCRLGGEYSKETVAFSRKRIREMLTGRVALEKVARSEYLREMREALAGITPFGFGEVCYRDFELTISGAAMIKQDMSHVETWPDLWQKDMYIPFKWDFSDLNEKMGEAAADPARTVLIASNAQNEYRRVLVTPGGREEFCEKFSKLLG